MRQPRIKVYPDSIGGWRWRLVSANGRILADSAESYKTARAAARGLATAFVAFREAINIPVPESPKK